MRGFLRISLIAITLAVSGVFGVDAVHAQEGPSLADKGLAGTYNARLVAEARDACIRAGERKNCSVQGIPAGGSTVGTNRMPIDLERYTLTFPDGSRIVSDKQFLSLAFKDFYYGPDNDDDDPVIDDGGFGDDVGDEETVAALDSGTCNPTDFGCHISKLPGMLMVGIGFIFLTISGLILFLAGTLFNWVVLRTVFQFGEYFGTSDGMLIAWGVMRDIANIGLLFAFILMGVLLILNVDSGGHGHGGGMSAKKAIPRLIIFAVLLNFSLFATQFVVDIANAFGSTFTTLAGDEQCSEGTTGEVGSDQTVEDCAVKTGISSKILHATGLTNIFGDDRGDLGAIMTNLKDRPYAYATSLIMLSVFVTVTAIVLLAGAIMLVIRVVVLSFLMVTSPVGFAGMVIPGLSGIAHKWWDTLIHQAFFAPIYLLLVFISIKLTEGLMGNGTNLTNAILGNSNGPGAAGNVQVVMVYAIVIGFMIAALISAQKFGAMGASFATGFAQRTATAPFSALGRNTVGRVSSKALKSYESFAGRQARNIDGMNNKVLKFAASSALNAANDVAGSTLTGGKNMKFFGGKSFAEEQKHREEQSSHNKHAADQAQQKLDLKNAQTAIAAATTDESRAEATDMLQTTLQKMGVTDIREYVKDNKDAVATIARNLSPEKFSSLMKDKDLSEDLKHTLSHARYEEIGGLKQAIETDVKGGMTGDDAFKKAKDKLKLWSNDDVANFAESSPAEFAALLALENDSGESLFSDEQRESLEKAKGLTNRQRQLVKDQAPVKRIDRYVAAGDYGKATALMSKVRKSKDRAKLDANTLVNTAVIDSLVPGDLVEIMNEAKLDPTQKDKVKSRIWTRPPNKNMAVLQEYLENKQTNSLVRSYWT